MVKVEVIEMRLRALREYLTYLEEKRSLSQGELLANVDAYYAVLHMLQLACQVSVDVASHILAADFSRRADKYKDVILALGAEGVVPQEFAQRFAGIAGFRSIVIHEYLAVDPVKVYELLQTARTIFVRLRAMLWIISGSQA
jgi:uncharacterized protein YutE (UPF0331/DUF86 family)